MCGIVAFLGKAKNANASFALTTQLMIKTERRGDDASGYWATEDVEVDESAVYFSKDAIKSTLFVKSDMWKIWNNKPISALVAHCRRSTRASENVNRNNHPFVTADYRTALVHNGVIPEFDSLRSSYDVISDCDSEILLRIIDRGSNYEPDYIRTGLPKIKNDALDCCFKDMKPEDQLPVWAPRLMGMRDIFARIEGGHMAVAMGERWTNGTRALWLFRNKERPLHVVDMRESLGQIFAVSEKSILRDAIDCCPEVKSLCVGNIPIVELPPNVVWLLTVDAAGEFDIHKWKVNKTRRYHMDFDSQRPPITNKNIAGNPPKVITNLTKDEKIDRSKDPPPKTNSYNSTNTSASSGKTVESKKKSGPLNPYQGCATTTGLSSNTEDWTSGCASDAAEDASEYENQSDESRRISASGNGMHQHCEKESRGEVSDDQSGTVSGFFDHGCGLNIPACIAKKKRAFRGHKPKMVTEIQPDQVDQAYRVLDEISEAVESLRGSVSNLVEINDAQSAERLNSMLHSLEGIRNDIESERFLSEQEDEAIG